jgi:hypothetical protein
LYLSVPLFFLNPCHHLHSAVVLCTLKDDRAAFAARPPSLPAPSLPPTGLVVLPILLLLYPFHELLVGCRSFCPTFREGHSLCCLAVGRGSRLVGDRGSCLAAGAFCCWAGGGKSSLMGGARGHLAAGASCSLAGNSRGCFAADSICRSLSIFL